MALILTSEEQALADSVRRFVADRSPLTRCQGHAQFFFDPGSGSFRIDG